MSLKKIVDRISRYLPGIGLVSLTIRDWRTRKQKPFPYYDLRTKEDWKMIGKYAVQVAWLAFFVLKAGVTYKGVQTLINKINKSKETEQIYQEKNKDNLEEKIKESYFFDSSSTLHY